VKRYRTSGVNLRVPAEPEQESCGARQGSPKLPAAGPGYGKDVNWIRQEKKKELTLTFLVGLVRILEAAWEETVQVLTVQDLNFN